MNKFGLRKYSNYNPNYNFTIDDSKKYNVNIYPFPIIKKCNNSSEFQKFLMHTKYTKERLLLQSIKKLEKKNKNK